MSTLAVDTITPKSANAVLFPNRPAFKAYNSTNGWVELTHGSAQLLNFNTTDYNIGGHYNTSTYKFTAPISGLYDFTILAYTQKNGAVRALYLYKNDALYSQSLTTDSTDMNQSGHLRDVMNLSAGDTVSAYLYHGNDTVYSYQAGDGTVNGAWSYFIGYLIG